MIKKIKGLFGAKVTTHKGLNLPPFRSNHALSDNETYLQSGADQVNALKKEVALTKDTVMLDFGCGQGRIVNSLEYTKTDVGTYNGVDTDERSINWCKKYLAPYDPKYNFIFLPAFNARYNDKGGELKDLPFEANTFDVIFLNSVFSHMLEKDVRFYLAQFFRTLKPGGTVYMTAFVEKDVPKEVENPTDYLYNPSGALHVVRFEHDFFMSMVTDSGLDLVNFYHQNIERTKQSVIIGRKPQ